MSWPFVILIVVAAGVASFFIQGNQQASFENKMVQTSPVPDSKNEAEDRF